MQRVNGVEPPRLYQKWTRHSPCKRSCGPTLLLSISRWMNWIWRQSSVSDATVSVIDFPFCIGAEITCEPIEAVVRTRLDRPFFFPLPHRSSSSILIHSHNFPFFHEISLSFVSPSQIESKILFQNDFPSSFISSPCITTMYNKRDKLTSNTSRVKVSLY